MFWSCLRRGRLSFLFWVAAHRNFISDLRYSDHTVTANLVSRCTVHPVLYWWRLVVDPISGFYSHVP